MSQDSDADSGAGGSADGGSGGDANSGAGGERDPTLTDLLDSPGRVRLLDVFLGRGSLPVSRGDLADLAGVHRSTVSRRLDEFHEYGLVEPVPETSDPELFRVDADHSAVGPLREAHARLFDHVDRLQTASDDYDSDDDLYVAGSPFVELFRSPANVDLFVALLDAPDERLTAAELARAAGVDRSTVEDNVDVLVDIEVARRSEQPFASGPRYGLADDSPVVERFRRAVDALGGGNETTTDADGDDASDGPDVAPAAAGATGTSQVGNFGPGMGDSTWGIGSVGGKNDLDEFGHEADGVEFVYETESAEVAYDRDTGRLSCEIDTDSLPDGVAPEDAIVELRSSVAELEGAGSASEDTSASHVDY
ncbi:helix-turn-helix domain-containing protein [Halobaculum sp. MBLA0143]|uniref:helix-turn-helix domain-containing protein n=1 Tax=Halobaculum sp. MBLA0143 TaxID=3079933 RepID=UPI0035248206